MTGRRCEDVTAKEFRWLREKWRIALEQRHLWEPAMAYQKACRRYRIDGDAAALQAAEVTALSALLAYASECEASVDIGSYRQEQAT